MVPGLGTLLPKLVLNAEEPHLVVPYSVTTAGITVPLIVLGITARILLRVQLVMVQEQVRVLIAVFLVHTTIAPHTAM